MNEEALKRNNFFKCQMMILEATKHMQFLFETKWRSIFKSFVKSEISNYFRTTNHGKNIRKELKKIQTTSLDVGDPNEWDLTLLGTLFQYEPFKSKKNLKWIQKLTEIRNKLFHSSDMVITDQEFENIYADFCASLTNLGYTDESKLASFKNDLFLEKPEAPENGSNFKDFESLVEVAFEEKNFNKCIELLTNAMLSGNLPDKKMAQLYYKRSLAYFELEKTTRDDINLQRSFLDAEKVTIRDPNWINGYTRCGETLEKLDDLEKSKKYFEKALIFDLKNQTIKNKIAFLQNKITQRQRKEHLDEYYQPNSCEEINEMFLGKKLKEIGINDEMTLPLSSDLPKEVKKFIDATNPGHTDVGLAHQYRHGSKNIKQNYEMAAKLYSKAANKNNAEALYNLADLHMNGHGVDVNYKLAISMLKKAAEQSPFIEDPILGKFPRIGVLESAHSLGLAYQNGIYVDKNYCLAVEWYERAIKLNSSNSANNLGLMYMDGEGVVRDLEKAEKLFLFAHKSGNYHCLTNLVQLYLRKNEPERALMWHERAIDSPSKLVALGMDEEVREAVKKQIKFKKEIKAFDENHAHESLVPNFSLENFFKLKNELLNNIPLKQSPYASREERVIFNLKMFEEYSMKGNEYAEKLLKAKKLFDYSINQLIFEAKKKDSNLRDEILKNMSQSYEIESLVCQIPLKYVDNVLEFLENEIETDLNIKNEWDCRARICYMFIKPNINFVNISLSKYPDQPTMMHYRGCLLCFDDKHEKALKDFNILLQKNPTQYEILYLKAAALRIIGQNKESIKSYNDFLAIAPIGHRKIPESFYALGTFKFIDQHDKKSLNRATDYYKKGLESEKEQVPCFLPYQSNSKKTLELALGVLNEVTSDNPSKSIEKIQRDLICQDFRRAELIINHRTFHHASHKAGFFQKPTFKPPKFQKCDFNSNEDVKEIFLKDIDFTRDHILKDSFITLINVDITTIGTPSTSFVVQDKNGYVERAAIYNLTQSKDEIEKMFPTGCVFTIRNPYIRMAFDGKPMIRVDDPKSLKLSDHNKIICRYCFKEGASFQCSKCQIAKYCCKDCQIDDWKLLKHKLICV